MVGFPDSDTGILIYSQDNVCRSDYASDPFEIQRGVRSRGQKVIVKSRYDSGARESVTKIRKANC